MDNHQVSKSGLTHNDKILVPNSERQVLFLLDKLTSQNIKNAYLQNESQNENKSFRRLMSVWC